VSRRTTISLDPLDDRAIAGIRGRYGGSKHAAIRLAVRVLAASPKLALPPPMPPMDVRVMTFQLYTADDEAIQVILDRYTQATTASGAIRLALHALNSSPTLQLTGETTE
jgi:hypothetical protein